jgi:hypothetical protein
MANQGDGWISRTGWLRREMGGNGDRCREMGSLVGRWVVKQGDEWLIMEMHE